MTTNETKKSGAAPTQAEQPHWEGCWRWDRRHHACAVAHIDRLDAQLTKVTRERDEARQDVKDAAGELMVNIDDAPAGSLVAKLLAANAIMRKERDNSLDLADAYHAIRESLDLPPDTAPQKVVDQVGRMKRLADTLAECVAVEQAALAAQRKEGE